MSTRLGARFVGRRAELALLETALAAAVAGSPQTVFIGGEAGIGKTRLVNEFAERVQDDARVLTGQCYELSAGGLLYGPAVEMLRKLAQSLDPAVRDELLGPAELELKRMAPTAGGSGGWPSSDAAGAAQAQFFELVLRVVDRTSRLFPLAMIVEDLHWADRSILDLLTFLAHNLQDERILLVCTYRSDELHGRRLLRTVLTDLERNAPTRQIELASFGREELAEQLRGILGAEPATQMVERVFARSAGNPFFAEELLAAGIESGEGGLPRRLRDIIVRRFDALSEDAQDVLRVVAAAGQISHHVLATASELAPRAQRQALREAVAQRFLLGDEQGVYSFRHELAREAIYADLLPGERVHFHAAIARALQQVTELDGDQARLVAAQLAHHWHAADEPANALAASIEAARLAAGVYAFTEAHHRLERALELWPRVPDAAAHAGMSHDQLLEQVADTALLAGDVERSLILIRDALAELDPEREPVRAGIFQERLGHYLWRWGDNDGSMVALTEANRLLASQGASPERARVLAAHAWQLMIYGRYSEARTLAEQALAMARAVGARREEGRALNIAGVAMSMRGDPDAGIAALVQARDIATEIEDFEDVLRAYSNLALALENAGRTEEAADEVLAGLAVARQRELDVTTGAGLLINAAEHLFLLGRWQEEEDLLRRGHRLEAAPRWGPFLTLQRAELALALGRFDQAEADLEATRRTSAHLLEPQFRGPLHAAMAELAISRGDHRAAVAVVQEGLDLLADSEDEPRALRLCALGIQAAADTAENARRAEATAKEEAARSAGATILETARRLAGKLVERAVLLPDAAAMLEVCEAEMTRLEGRARLDHWERAIATWERLRRPYLATYARWRQAQAMLTHGDAVAAAQVLGRARTDAVRLGAEPLRRRIEFLAARNGMELPPPDDEGGNL
jgi:tetratricopeptide (TPR) repeat protein